MRSLQGRILPEGSTSLNEVEYTEDPYAAEIDSDHMKMW